MESLLSSADAMLATAWLCTLVDGTIIAFTDHDRDFDFDLESYLAGIGYSTVPGFAGTGTQTYQSTAGYQATDVETSAALNVDNLEVHGLLSAPSITEDALRAGLWDYANVCVFFVNWADLTMGAVVNRIGRLGRVTIDGGTFKAEIRGLMQAYSRVIGQLTSASCRADLGDARCQVVLTSWTVAGTVDSVSTDGLVIYDTARTEAGPTGGIAITGITQADPGVVTLAATCPFVEGQPVNMSGILGMTALNTVVSAHNPSGATFTLTIDTTSFPPYSSGGAAVGLGSDSGYFDAGLLTITSGANAGLGNEVKSYTPGQLVLQLPFPYAVEVGATYSLHAGCEKSMTTCRDRFSNFLNFRGEPYLPGVDRMVQVGRH